MLMLIIIIALLAIGLALIIAEIVFIPGTTLVGVLGLIFSVAGIFISYQHYGSDVGFYILLGMSILTAASLFYSFKTGVWSKFSLKDSNQGKVNEGMLSNLTVGEEGTALSTLRPVGKAQFNKQEYEVKTLGDYVDHGTPVRIKLIVSNQIIVEPIN
jgi:membrane-bound ClpP family serine protease